MKEKLSITFIYVIVPMFFNNIFTRLKCSCFEFLTIVLLLVSQVWLIEQPYSGWNMRKGYIPLVHHDTLSG